MRRRYVVILMSVVILGGCGSASPTTPEAPASVAPTVTESTTPAPTPAPSVTSSPETTATAAPSPTPTVDPMPTVTRVIDQLAAQPRSEISAVSIVKFKTRFKSMWKRHAASIAAVRADPDPKTRGTVIDLIWQQPCDEKGEGSPTLRCALADVAAMETGYKGASGGERAASRTNAAAGVVVGMLLIYQVTDDVSLKKDLLPLIDMAYDYGSRVKVGGFSINGVREMVDGNIPASLSWYLLP